MWARIEENNVVETTLLDPDSYGPGLKFIKVPEEFHGSEFTNFIYNKDTDSVEPNLGAFKVTKLKDISRLKTSAKNQAVVQYKDVNYPVDDNTRSLLTSKLIVATNLEKSSKAKYSTTWKQNGEYTRLTATDLNVIIQKIDEYVDTLIEKEEHFNKELKSMTNWRAIMDFVNNLTFN